MKKTAAKTIKPKETNPFQLQNEASCQLNAPSPGALSISVKTFAMPWSLGPSWCCAFWDPPLRHNPNASGASVESVTGNLPLANVMRNLVWW